MKTNGKRSGILVVFALCCAMLLGAAPALSANCFDKEAKCRIRVIFTNSHTESIQVAWVKYTYKGSSDADVTGNKFTVKAGKTASKKALNCAKACSSVRIQIKYKAQCKSKGHTYKVVKSSWIKSSNKAKLIHRVNFTSCTLK